MADIELLKRLAEDATQGEWERDGSEIGPVWDQNTSIAKFSKREDAAFVAAASPATVLALIAENSRLRQIISDSATACDAAMFAECTVEFMGHLPAEITGVLGQIRAELERLRAERSAMASALMRIVDLSNSGHGPIRSYRQMLDIAAEARQVLSLEVANG